MEVPGRSPEALPSLMQRGAGLLFPVLGRMGCSLCPQRPLPIEETPFEAGVRVQIHSQEEPPVIDQLGFGAAPGYQTFVSCQQQQVSSPVPPSRLPAPASPRTTSTLKPAGSFWARPRG